MAFKASKFIQKDKLKHFPFMEAGIALIVIIVLAALFIDTKSMPTQSSPRMAQTGGSNALEFDVLNVNTIIAKDFNLPYVAGVLVNNAPTGAAHRIIDLRRGDIILKYNQVEVQSANHLAFLMAQSKPGDTVTFVISRNAKTLTISNKIPAETGIDIFAPQGRDILVVLVILILTFTMLFLNLFNRTVCVTLGAVLMLVAGSVFGFYTQGEAFDAIRLSPIFILVGMSIFAIFLEELRFFEYVGKKIIIALKADMVKVILVFAALTAISSAFVDNISTILILLPVIIYAARGLNFNPVPVVVAMIIASNIGGTATAIGDFPNMLIASTTGLTFVDFLIFMTPICTVFLGIFLWYMWFTEFRHQNKTRSVRLEKLFLKRVEEEVNQMQMNWPEIKKVLYILGCVLVAFVILPAFKIQLAQIALGGGFLLLAIENHRAKDVIKKISLTDLLFFIALFLLVGGALFSGLLKVISDILTAASMGNKILYPILLMWAMAAFTAVLNSGPATAFFIPIVMHSGYADFTDVVWWAVSLGSLAGACACLSGASAGIVAPTIVEELHTAHLDDKNKESLNFSSYSRRGIPIAMIFLVISSIYIAFLSMTP